MSTALKSGVLLPLLLAAMLLPKMGAALIELKPGVRTVVLCTGSNMVTMRIGPDGHPIEVEEGDTGPCVMATSVAAAAVPLPLWIAVARSHKSEFVPVTNPLNRHDRALLNRDSQGPPFGLA